MLPIDAMQGGTAVLSSASLHVLQGTTFQKLGVNLKNYKF